MENEVMIPEISNDEKNLALLSHVFGIFTSVVGSLVIWLIKKGKSPFVEEQSLEALNFQITILIATAVAGVMSIIPTSFFLIPLLTIYNIAMCIIAAISARDGKSYKYPVILRLIQ